MSLFQLTRFKTFALSLILLVNSQVIAQELTLKQVKEREQTAEETIKLVKTDQQNIIELGKTPLSTIIAIREAFKVNDLTTASHFLDLRYLDKSIVNQSPEELIRKLIIVWSQHHIIDISSLSNEPDGYLKDGLPSYRELLGVITLKKKSTAIYLQKVPSEAGGHIWKVSNQSVAKIPELWREYGYHPAAESIARFLPEFKILDMQNWQFVSFIIILIVSWYITALIRWLMVKIIGISEVYSQTMSNFIRLPFRMFLYFILLQWAISYLGLSISSRVWLDSGTLSYLAAIFLSLGIVEFTFALFISKSHKDKNMIAIIRPIVTTLKIVLVIVIVLNWFDDAGFDITTIVTGLGIGSLAVALAAQKSLENVFGAFTLFIARPIKPGDFCRFGDITGTVEEIGLRSTRIRKLNRSVVHVPNSVIASQDLENFSEIDYRRYYKSIRIRLDTPPEKIRFFLNALKDLIKDHERTLDFENRVRFETIEEDAFIIVLSVYINTNNLFEFKAIEEDINLKIIELTVKQNIELALPEKIISIEESNDK